jgi:hypothetical protein
MANTIIGRIYRITPTENIATKKGTTFMKRQLIIDASRYDPYTGEKKFDNFPAFEVGGEELCRLLEGYRIDDLVTVSFDLNGREFLDDQTKQTKYFTTVRAYKIERVQSGPVSQQQKTQQTSSVPKFNSVQSAPTMEDAFKQNDDLPF